MATDSAAELQHPRRSLGNRHRAQAERFLRLAEADPERGRGNLGWAEQSAQQALLHDFTHEGNWWVLARVKRARGDAAGLRAVLGDLFTVLGRDSELLVQLDGVDLLEVGVDLLLGALAADPLDADAWWKALTTADDVEAELVAFDMRCDRLDFRDQRANIIFGRRLERVRRAGHVDRFVRKAQRLLAHRPANHELWVELGRLHEQREAWDDAWLAYDQAQHHRPQPPVRDQFRSRLERRMDMASGWRPPTLDRQASFHVGMERLARRLGTTTARAPVEEAPVEEEAAVDDRARLDDLLAQGEAQQAFFLARRLLTQGEAWAADYVEWARQAL